MSFRLKEISEQICSRGYTESSLFNNLPKVVVEAVVSINYIAFLLEDGRICRVSYNVNTDKLDNNTVSTQSTAMSSSGSANNNAASTDLSKKFE